MRLPIFALLLLVFGCGGGNVGDLFGAFPEGTFTDPDDGGDDGPPVPFSPQEVASLGESQGVGGDVKNVVTVALGDNNVIAFVAAGDTGVHVINVTDPDLLDEGDVIGTIGPASLNSGRCDALTIVDNRFLICLGVGTVSANAVTVFDVVALLADDGFDPVAALVAPTAGSAIPASGTTLPGTTEGDGGGVSGAGGRFFVASGGPLLFSAAIDTVAATWTANLPTPTLPEVQDIVDVLLNPIGALYLSAVTTDLRLGILSVGFLADGTPSLPVFTEINDEFENLLNQSVVGPGTFPIDLALDTLTLFVSGQNEVSIFTITNPTSPSLTNSIEMTGEFTISVAANGGQLAVGAGDQVSLYSVFGGQAQRLPVITFPGIFRVTGVTITSSDRGVFVLACAGERGGLRVIQVTQSQ